MEGAESEMEKFKDLAESKPCLSMKDPVNVSEYLKEYNSEESSNDDIISIKNSTFGIKVFKSRFDEKKQDCLCGILYLCYKNEMLVIIEVQGKTEGDVFRNLFIEEAKLMKQLNNLVKMTSALMTKEDPPKQLDKSVNADEDNFR